MSTHDDDDDLRALLRETAEQITPHGSYEDVQMRLGKRSGSYSGSYSGRRWVLPSLAAAAALALVVGGIGWVLHDHDHGSLGPSGPPTGGTGVVHREGTVYYLGDTANGPRLFPEQTDLEANDSNPLTFALPAVEAAVAGKPADPDYRSAWPAGVKIVATGLGAEDNDVVQINFEQGTKLDRPAGMSAEVARLSVEQLVRTIQAVYGTEHGVEFYLAKDDGNGQLLGVDKLDHVLGVDTSQPMTAGDDSDLAPVQITNLTDGEHVNTGPVSVTGVANTFEANVVWEVKSGDIVVDHGFTTAKECCTLAPYSFTTKGLPAGTYTIVAHDTDESGSGRPVDSDTKEIVVQ